MGENELTKSNNGNNIPKSFTEPLEDKPQTTRIIGFYHTDVDTDVEKHENDLDNFWLKKLSDKLFDNYLFDKYITYPVANWVDFVKRYLEKNFGDNLTRTYSNFMKQIEETAKISSDNDLTFIIIQAHGNGKVEKPYIRIEKEKLEYTTLLEKLGEIKGIKVILLESCGSGRLKEIIEKKENKDEYWLITSASGKQKSFAPICRKPWKVIFSPGKTLDEKFEYFKNRPIAKFCQKAEYKKGRNVSIS